MPGWHKRTQALQAAGKIQIVGIVQEQHAERCRLFKQWQGFQWPIAVDSLNLYGLPSIPIAMAVDEHGILRMSRVRPGEKFDKFLKTKYPEPQIKSPPKDYQNLDACREQLKIAETAENLIKLGTAEFLFGGKDRLTRAITAFERACDKEPANAIAAFRLGVAYRRRFDESRATTTDFQSASAAWSKALDLNPGQYIWRRRIQQFGPRLQKPYNFYRWISTAKKELIAAKKKPVALTIPLTASEKMQKEDTPAVTTNKNPDPKKMVSNDDKKLARVARAVVPAKVSKGKTARLHILLSPSKKLRSHWDPEAGPIKLWLEGDLAWKRSGTLSQSNDLLSIKAARSVEIEVQIPVDAESGPRELKGFVLYPICEDTDGTCQFLRQDFSIEVRVK